MDILLDTHILLWYLTDNQKLSRDKSALLENVNNRKFLSIVSLWEIAIKKSIGKLEINKPIHVLVPNEIFILDLKITHIERVMDLPFFHKDPFDRIIIAQALTENLTVLTDDENFKQYGVKII